MDKLQFQERFVKFWIKYNPADKLSAELKRSADLYFQELSVEKIDFPTVDRILSWYEKENTILPYRFNVAAYILDFVAMERMEDAQNQIDLDKLPIVLPIEGKPIRIIDKPSLSEAVSTIKKNCPELMLILERINARRVHITYVYCHACDNTGLIVFSVFVDKMSKKKIRKYHQPSDKADYTIAMRCTCSKGSIMSSKTPQVTADECKEIASLKGLY